MSSLVRKSSVVFLANLVILAIGFVYHVPIVRILGPELYGRWGLAYTMIDMIAPLSLLGIGLGVTHYIAKGRASQDPAAVRSTLRSAFAIQIVGSLFLISAVGVFSYFFVEKIYPYPGVAMLTVLLSLTIPFTGILQISEAAFQATEDVYSAFGPKLLAESLKLAIIPIGLWWSHGSLRLFAILSVAIGATAGLRALRLIHRKLTPIGGLLKGADAQNLVRDLISFSLPLMFTYYVQAFSYRMDMFMIGYFMSDTAVGLYRPALTISGTTWMVPQALSYFLFPVMSRLWAEDRKRCLDFSERAFVGIAYASLPAACGFVIFSRPVMHLLYGARYIDGNFSLKWLALGIAAQTLTIVPSWIIITLGETALVAWINVAGAVFNVAANWILIPRIGIEGAAIATFGNFLLMMALTMIACRKLISQWILPKRLLPVIGGLIVTAVLSVTAGHRGSDGLGFNFLVFGALAIVFVVSAFTLASGEMRLLWDSYKNWRRGTA